MSPASLLDQLASLDPQERLEVATVVTQTAICARIQHGPVRREGDEKAHDMYRYRDPYRVRVRDVPYTSRFLGAVDPVTPGVIVPSA
jgi:hypothetical protein